MPSLDAAGTRVEYFEQGHGEPVVLLHSSASSSAQWRALAAQLSGHYRVIAPDLHGYGGTSNWPGSGAFRLEREAEIVYALLGRCAERAHLVGHSFGGAVALHAARTRPDLLASVAVIEPVAFHVLRGHDAEALAEIEDVAADVAKALASGDYFEGMARFVDYWSGPGAWETIPPEKRPGFAARLGKVALDFEATLSEPAGLADYGSVALPALVVQGTRSPRPTRRICELLAHALPNAQAATVQGAGHMAPLTHRDAVGALVSAHLSSRGFAARRCAARSAGGWRTGRGSATCSA